MNTYWWQWSWQCSGGYRQWIHSIIKQIDNKENQRNNNLHCMLPRKVIYKFLLCRHVRRLIQIRRWGCCEQSNRWPVYFQPKVPVTLMVWIYLCTYTMVIAPLKNSITVAIFCHEVLPPQLLAWYFGNYKYLCAHRGDGMCGWSLLWTVINISGGMCRFACEYLRGFSLKFLLHKW